MGVERALKFCRCSCGRSLKLGSELALGLARGGYWLCGVVVRNFADLVCCSCRVVLMYMMGGRRCFAISWLASGQRRLLRRSESGIR